MTTEEFLRQAKKLIANKKTYFSQRRDYDTAQALLDLGIVHRSLAWREILRLVPSDQYKPPELDHNGSNNLVFFFRKEINGVSAYIKLSIDQNLCMCISFHPEGYTTKP
ncbi:type II toxin-antitoxin system MqsR family toxin [Saccharibacillus brassicae]|uniref:Type II toxin-antitoxin system MqsR family toxin n=1 Tax=Saccharibacillus brassicae TaxID=2583377 RepID=A0A4Y6UPG1_SACBS|nr:type II toxin-antitoxin system MqsR family toxin [Saccharibacillus brassicae]QDH19539.1 type II toxin-antitoxin system MqsR family toxin [Saccharibacillus brassicae]